MRSNSGRNWDGTTQEPKQQTKQAPHIGGKTPDKAGNKRKTGQCTTRGLDHGLCKDLPLDNEFLKPAFFRRVLCDLSSVGYK